MTKEESAKVLAVKYVLDYNTFRRSERLKEDLGRIMREYYKSGDKEFIMMFQKYCDDLRGRSETPRWAKMIMAERYALNV